MNRNLFFVLMFVLLFGCSQKEGTEQNLNNQREDTFELEAHRLLEQYESSFALPLRTNVDQFASEKITQDTYFSKLNRIYEEHHTWHKDVRRNLWISNQEKSEIKQKMRHIKQQIYMLGYAVESAKRALQSNVPFYKKYYATKDSQRDGTGPIEDIDINIHSIRKELRDYNELRKKYPVPQPMPDAVENEMPEQMPQDFEFLVKFGVGAKNVLNTFENTFTKDMVMDPAITISLKLSQEEKKLVYEQMRQIHIWDYPTRFRPDTDTIQSPQPSYYLRIQINGEQKEIFWKQGIASEEDVAVKFKELLDWYIRDEIIFSRPEYKQLPEARGGYM